ncbi:MAG TPA: hypothetical protein VGO45_06760 [Bacteroidia bacterium]|jgi:hypothetical protein|nr:hypothetical protein [Bacteroidia bacterium]
MEKSASAFKTPKSIPEVPCLFTAYLNTHFSKAFIWGINTIVDISGQFVYKVELSDAANLYHLKFNLDGELLSMEKEAMI